MKKTTEKMTGWIDADIKPTIVGWYERDYAVPSLTEDRDWWDGEQFIIHKDDPRERVALLSLRWRGLASNPNKGA